MRMGELKRERVGLEFFAKNDMDECDKGEEMNVIEYVSNNGEKISRLWGYTSV